MNSLDNDTAPTYIWLLPTLELVAKGEGFYLRFENKSYNSELFSKPVFDFIKSIDGNSTEDSLDQNMIFSIIKPLFEKMGWIVRLRNPIDFYIKNFEIYTRQLSYYAHLCRNYPDETLLTLQGMKVAVLGMGGIGSLVAHNLAGAGVGTLHLFDFDEVEATNFNRQILYTQEDLGKKKADSAAEFLRKKFPRIEIKAFDVNFDKETFDLDGFDLILLCGECYGLYSNPKMLDRQNILRAGYAGATGIVGPLVRKNSGLQWKDLVWKSDGIETVFFPAPNKRPNNWNASGSTINTVVSGLMAEEALRFLSPNLGECKTSGYELNIEMKTFQISYRPVS